MCPAVPRPHTTTADDSGLDNTNPGDEAMRTSIWKHVISTLRPMPLDMPSLSAPTVGKPTIRLLEVSSDITITVSWTDPQGGNYQAQIWRLRRAQHDGECSVTGAPIARGDSVYTPLPGGDRPANADAMIASGSLSHLMQ